MYSRLDMRLESLKQKEPQMILIMVVLVVIAVIVAVLIYDHSKSG